MLMYLTIIDSKEGQQKFEFIYNRYKKLMFYIANKILGDTRDSEDTVHDAFLKIIEIIDDIKDVESPQTRWETVIQSPYSIEFPAKQVKRLILEEFFPETGEWEAARLGIERWVAGDYEDFLSAADKDEELMQQNTALTGYRSFRANYRAGYWEMILVHTRPLEVVPKDMRVS